MRNSLRMGMTIIAILFIPSLLVDGGLSSHAQSPDVTALKSVQEICDGASSLVASGQQAQISVGPGLDVTVNGTSNAIEIRKNGNLVEKIENYTAQDRQRCIETVIEYLKSSSRDTEEIEKIDVIHATFPTEENDLAYSILEKSDGEYVFVGVINMDYVPGIDINNNIFENCSMGGDVDLVNDRVSELEFPLPMTMAHHSISDPYYKFNEETYSDYSCFVSVKMFFSKPTVLPFSSGGTGIANHIVRKKFLVNMSFVGSSTTFHLREE
jgi:hypothetical protein